MELVIKNPKSTPALALNFHNTADSKLQAASRTSGTQRMFLYRYLTFDAYQVISFYTTYATHRPPCTCEQRSINKPGLNMIHCNLMKILFFLKHSSLIILEEQSCFPNELSVNLLYFLFYAGCVLCPKQKMLN